MSETKVCSTCGEEKDLSLFVKNSNQCKKCKAAYAKQYAIDNTVDIRAKKKKKYEDNKEIALAQAKDYYENNKEKKIASSKKYRDDNVEPLKKSRRKYVVKNIVAITKNSVRYERERKKTDPAYKLRKETSASINSALKATGSSKAGKSITKYLPYTMVELKEHLEKQFEPWMTWQNKGTYRIDDYDEDNKATWTWHIDHIIPKHSLPYVSMNDENFQKCWSLSNLRPLRSIDNIKKGNKII